jgi:hypothetical protein
MEKHLRIKELRLRMWMLKRLLLKEGQRRDMIELLLMMKNKLKFNLLKGSRLEVTSQKVRSLSLILLAVL